VLNTHDAEMRVFRGCGQDGAIGGRCSYVKALEARVGGVDGGAAAQDDTVGVHAVLDASSDSAET
jgi:hypothetical protein